MRILFAGEAMAELRRSGEGVDGANFAVGFAGDTFNSAVYCRRILPPGHEVAFLTRLGTDPLSDGFAALAAAEGVTLLPRPRDAARNLGIYSVQTDAAGERSFHYWRSQSAARQLFGEEGDLAALEGFDLIVLSGITLAIISAEARQRLLARIAALRGQGLRLAFDSNYRPRLWPDRATAQAAVEAAWRITDIALPSVDDEQALFGDADAEAVLRRLKGWGCRQGALKRGAEGPLSFAEGVAPGPFEPAGKVVDSTAAGDSFNAGYLAALALGRDERAALACGHATARAVVGHPGAIIPRAAMPDYR